MELILVHVKFPYAFLLYLSQFLVFVMTCSAASLDFTSLRRPRS
jgi:hypothetical protein